MAKILIVDDRASNREVLHSLLKYRDHELLEASDGMEALAVSRCHHPDLVITDLAMPRMDGFELARQLRSFAETEATQVIFYSSAYREIEARQIAEKCGVLHVLAKPAQPQEIVDAVDLALTRHASFALPPVANDFEREHRRALSDKLSEKR